MIKITVLYPHEDGKRFDMDDYRGRHIPMALRLMGDACRGFSVERGLPDARDGSPPRYRVIASLLFDSMQSYTSIDATVRARMADDLPNYTDIRPIVQVSEVLASVGPIHERQPNGASEAT